MRGMGTAQRPAGRKPIAPGHTKRRVTQGAIPMPNTTTVTAKLHAKPTAKEPKVRYLSPFGMLYLAIAAPYPASITLGVPAGQPALVSALGQRGRAAVAAAQQQAAAAQAQVKAMHAALAKLPKAQQQQVQAALAAQQAS